jgi:hypothetical protein
LKTKNRFFHARLRETGWNNRRHQKDDIHPSNQQQPDSATAQLFGHYKRNVTHLSTSPQAVATGGLFDPSIGYVIGFCVVALIKRKNFFANA